MVWFCNKIIPKLREQGNFQLKVVGRRPLASVQALKHIEGVEIVGEVPDVRPYLHEADIAISPLKLARGIQNKVLEAMATELPCVLSPHAFSPLGLPTEGHTEVCQDAESFAQKIDALLDHPEQAQAMAQRAKQQVEVVFSWEQHGRRLHDILKETSQLK